MGKVNFTVGELISKIQSAGDSAAPNGAAKTAWDTACNTFRRAADFISNPISLDYPEPPVGGGGGGNQSPAGVDPTVALRRLAEAVTEAESKLNQQQLVISSGTIDVTLKVEVAGALADAEIKLDIQPKEFR